MLLFVKAVLFVVLLWSCLSTHLRMLAEDLLVVETIVSSVHVGMYVLRDL